MALASTASPMRSSRSCVRHPVDPQHHDRGPAVELLGDLRRLDVDLLLAEQRADGAHHARPVGVGDDQQVALGAQVEVPVVDLDQLGDLVAAPDSVPDTVRDSPSAIAARSVTDER